MSAQAFSLAQPRQHARWCAVLLVAVLGGGACRAAVACDPATAAARVVSATGKVTLDDRPLATDAPLCAGSTLATGTGSRVVLRLTGSQSLLHLDGNTRLTLPAPATPGTLGLLRGALSALLRQPGELAVETPVVNAAIRGTEYLLRVADDGTTAVSVYHGRVAVSGARGPAAASGAVTLETGERLLARPRAALASADLKVAVARDELAWSVYFPPVLGNDAPAAARDAARLLAGGQVEAAERLLSDAGLDLVPAALAVRAVAAVARNDPTAAQRLADAALALDPDDPAARVADSYAKQARRAVDRALATLETCRAAPRCARRAGPLFEARRIELLLANNRLREARRACRDASGDAYAIPCGFVALGDGATANARAAFARATRLQPASPLARVGLGLALIRANALAAGRAELETAVLLDPLQSVLRSYLGRAYFEEQGCPPATKGQTCAPGSRRPLVLALEQFELARGLDPADPTPSLFSAQVRAAYHEPVAALRDLEDSLARNGNRAIYRSGLLIDQDEGARAAGLAEIYRDLGFEQRALAEGYRAVAVDPAAAAAHRFLADTYDTLPRHDLARASEALQAQLLQPVNAPPMAPAKTEGGQSGLDRVRRQSVRSVVNAACADRAGPATAGECANSLARSVIDQPALSRFGPSTLSFDEYSSAFLRDGVRGRFKTYGGEHGALGQTGLAGIVDGGFAAHAGYDGYVTDGNRENDDQRNRLYAAFTQYSPQSGSSVMAEYKHSERDYGDLRRLLDDSLRRATLRQSENVDQYRLGFRHDLAPGSTLIGHYTRRIAFSQARDDGPFTGTQTFGPLRLDTSSNDHQIEWQHLWTASKLLSSVCGGGWNGRLERSGLDFAPQRQQGNTSTSGAVAAESATSESRANLYCYGTLSPAATLALTLGLSIDHEENAFRTGAQLDPKLGLRWALAPGTSLRLAATRTLQRPLANGQTLEPTQVAGFNQFFADEQATRAWRYGIGLDHRASASLYLGAETSWRELDFPLGVVGEQAVSGNRAQEWTVLAFGNWTPDERWALRSEIAFERFTYDLACPSPDELRQLDTTRWTTGARYFLPYGLSLDLEANLLAQTGQTYGSAVSCPGTNAVLPARDARFWVADAALRYRPAESATALALVARNLNDETRGYQETDTGTPRFTVGREVLLLVSVDLERAWRNRGLFD